MYAVEQMKKEPGSPVAYYETREGFPGVNKKVCYVKRIAQNARMGRA